MNKTLRSLILAAAAILPTTAVLASEGQSLRIATEGAYPPFNFFTADGQLGGFDIEIGRALCAQPFCAEMNYLWSVDRAQRR